MISVGLAQARPNNYPITYNVHVHIHVHEHVYKGNYVDAFYNDITGIYIYMFTLLCAAQLLCQGDKLWNVEEDCDLLQEGHCPRRGNHLRLQVPH